MAWIILLNRYGQLGLSPVASDISIDAGYPDARMYCIMLEAGPWSDDGHRVRQLVQEGRSWSPTMKLISDMRAP